MVTRGFKRGMTVTRGFARAKPPGYASFATPTGYDYDALDRWIARNFPMSHPCECGSAGIIVVLEKIARTGRPEICPKCDRFITVEYAQGLLDRLK